MRGDLSFLVHIHFQRSPCTPPLQLLARHAALERGSDVDKPRNLAESVTVE